MKARFDSYPIVSVAIVVLMAMVSSCNEYEESSAITAGEAEALERNQRYKEDFEQSFGPIDPQHTWGFVGIPAAGESRMTRAAGAPVAEERRVMCEDLASFDHDFNDVVFDVMFINVTDEGKASARITLQAAGGTLPVYIGSSTQDDAYEVHHLFGVSSVTPVNVQTSGVKREPVTFMYPEPIQGEQQQDGTWLFDPNKIEIYVGNTTGQVAQLQTQVGGAPQKFACATSVTWSQELQNINQGYRNFGTWTQDDSGWQDAWANKNLNQSTLYGESLPAPKYTILPITTGVNEEDSTK